MNITDERDLNEERMDCYQYGTVPAHADEVERAIEFVKTKLGSKTNAIHGSRVIPAPILETLLAALSSRSDDRLREALELHVTYEATPADRGGKSGPKGRAYAAFIEARDAALEAPTDKGGGR